MKLRSGAAAAVTGAAVAGMAVPASSLPVTFERLLNADAEAQSNWRHSGLPQINKQTFSTSANISGGVMADAVDGRRHVAVQAGSDRGGIDGVRADGALGGGTPILQAFGLPT